MNCVKKIVINMFMLLSIVGSIGCSSKQKTNIDYLLCNDTSLDDMAEIESGFYYVFEDILYYADKDDMSTWVPVCNRADCFHDGSDCNAYIGFELAQKDNKLYFVSDRIDYGNVNVYEIALDGSGRKKIYEIPFDCEILSFRGLISSSSLNMSYTCLTENGFYKSTIARLEEDGSIYPLYSETNEEQVDNLFMAGTSFQVRGKEVVASSRLTFEYTDETGLDVQNVLWRLDKEEPELVTLPDDVSIGWCYLTDESCFDFGEYEDGIGYYQIDLISGEKTLLGKPQKEDAWGYIMTDECVVESNRFINQAPEDAYLRIYYKDKWLNVQLPDEVTNAQLKKTAFLPCAVASDRIFFKQSDNGTEGYSCRLYYVMLNEETPKLTYCTTFGSESYFEITEETEKAEDIDWTNLETTIVDTEDYLLKVTGVGLDAEYKSKGKDVYKITVYCENKTSKEIRLSLSNLSINGIQTNYVLSNISVGAGKSKEDNLFFNEVTSEKYGIGQVYDFDEYTDITIQIENSNNSNCREIIHIYPKGEECATHYEREVQSTDQVLFDNEYVTITVVGFESKEMENDTARLCIKNKTNQTIATMADITSVVNGITLQNSLLSSVAIEPILPYCTLYEYVTVPKELLVANQISSIENWEVEFRVWDEDDWYTISANYKNTLFEEIFTITP